jgi:hypothetical protein
VYESGGGGSGIGLEMVVVGVEDVTRDVPFERSESVVGDSPGARMELESTMVEEGQDFVMIEYLR